MSFVCPFGIKNKWPRRQSIKSWSIIILKIGSNDFLDLFFSLKPSNNNRQQSTYRFSRIRQLFGLAVDDITTFIRRKFKVNLHHQPL